MFVYFYVKLRKGDLCVVNKDGHPHQGQIVQFEQLEYAMQYPVFVFKTEDGCRVVLETEFDYSVLPYKESLRFLIDLAMDLRDEAWVKELADQLLYRCQSS